MKRQALGASWTARRVGLSLAAVALAVAFGAGFATGEISHGGNALAARRQPRTPKTSASSTTTAAATTVPLTTTSLATTTTAAPLHAVIAVPATIAPASTTTPPCTGTVTGNIQVSAQPTIDSGVYNITVTGAVTNHKSDPIDNVLVSYRLTVWGTGTDIETETGLPTPTPIPVGGTASFTASFPGLPYASEESGVTSAVTLINYSDTSGGYGCGNGSTS